MHEYTNVIPADLPYSILNDRILGGYLADFPTVSFKKDDWQKFQDYIQGKIDSIPKNLELSFLEWCVKMLKINLAKHNKGCKQDPLNCSINQGYDRRLQYIGRLIEEVRLKYRPPVPVYPQRELPNFSNNPPAPVHKSADKIQWLGTQKELAELFIRLKAKGWIADFEPETIKDCFTNANSIQQLLKPGEYTEDLGGTFEQVFTPEYSPKFHGISPNTKRNK